MSATITCDTRIDEWEDRFHATCPCGWVRQVAFGRKLPVPMTKDAAYNLTLESVRSHRAVSA